MNKIQNKNIILALSLLVIFGGILLVSPQKASALNASYNITETTSGSYVSSNNNGYDGSMYGDNGYNSNNYTTNNVVTDNTNYNATPIIYSITPNSAVSGNNNILVTITGSNFSTSATARFNGSDKETRYYDSKHLGMVLSPIDLDGKGTYLVSVYNPSNGSVSNGVSFTLNRVVAASSAGTVAKKTVAKKATATTVAKAKTTSTSTSNNSNALTANALSGSNGFLPSSLIEWLLLAILIFLVVILVRKTYMAKEEHAPLKHA
jgi:hypothetical protein